MHCIMLLIILIHQPYKSAKQNCFAFMYSITASAESIECLTTWLGLETRLLFDMNKRLKHQMTFSMIMSMQISQEQLLLLYNFIVSDYIIQLFLINI